MPNPIKRLRNGRFRIDTLDTRGRRCRPSFPTKDEAVAALDQIAATKANNVVEAFARFWSKVHIGAPQDCWPYSGGVDQDGYGIFADSHSKSVRAHRFAFKCATGHDAVNLVLHRCNNPPCCNPMHLYDGTAQDNSNDCFAAGNFKTVFVAGDQHPNARLTNDQVCEALNLLNMGHSQRSVAKRFGVAPTAIYYHVKKRIVR